MSETMYRYLLTDDEGDKQRVNYINHGSCMCCGDCNDDELQIFEGEDDSQVWSRIQIEGSEMKWLIRDLLTGSRKIELLS